MDVLRAGVVGLGAYGKGLLAALAANEHYTVVAVADLDKERVEPVAEEYELQGYDDYRSLIGGQGGNACLQARASGPFPARSATMGRTDGPGGKTPANRCAAPLRTCLPQGAPVVA